jgi:hypothetical protein
LEFAVPILLRWRNDVVDQSIATGGSDKLMGFLNGCGVVGQQKDGMVTTFLGNEIDIVGQREVLARMLLMQDNVGSSDMNHDTGWRNEFLHGLNLVVHCFP